MIEITEQVVVMPVIDSNNEATDIKLFELRGHQVAFCKDELEQATDGIARCDHTRDNVTTATVIGVGPDVNCRETDKGRVKAQGWTPRMHLPLKKGDRILLPDGCDSMNHPFGIPHEGLIHAHDIIGVVRGL